MSAPCEAEAQCAELVSVYVVRPSSRFYQSRNLLLQVKKGKVYAVGTEDMDALTFGSNILLRHLTFSEARKMPIKEFHYDKVLEGLEMTRLVFYCHSL